MNCIPFYFASFVLLMQALIGPAPFAAQSDTIDTGRINSRLISSHHSVTAGADFDMALDFELDPDWHSYWKNPGDSGAPIHVEWNMPEWLSTGEIIWPLPKRIVTGPLMTYGLEDAVVLSMPYLSSCFFSRLAVTDAKTVVIPKVPTSCAIPQVPLTRSRHYAPGALKKAGIEYEKTFTHPASHTGYYPGASQMSP